MNTEDFLKELSIAYGSINKISTAVSSPEGIVGNADYPYLKDKMETFCITVAHTFGQIKGRVKEQKYGKAKKPQR